MQGKVAVLTGAAGDIGVEITRKLLQEGVRVIALDLQKERLEDLFGPGEENLDIRLLDIRDVTAIQKAFADIKADYGQLDYLINSAGVCQAKDMLEVTREDWDFMLEINLRGTFFCMQEAIKIMLDKQIAGRIVNLSSIAGQTGGFKVAPNYGASKAGVIAITKAFAKKGGPHNITVNAIAPGTIKSSMSDEFDTEGIIKNTPMGRLGTAEEIAAVILFLLSSQASYINGATIDVNGGVYLR